MDEDQVSRLIGDIERGFRREDPVFVQQLRHLQRRDAAMVLSVFVLLAASAVLLVTGMAARSWPIWVAGVIALVASVLVDEQRKRSLGRPGRP